MSEISQKPGWRFVKISDCCDQISDRIDNPSASGLERFVGLEHMQTRETLIREWGSTDDVTSTMKLFEPGDVLVARRNVYLERAAKADFDGVCSGDAIVLRPKDKHCLPELLPFILNTNQFWAYANSQADGSMSKRLSVARLMNYEFALPPLDVQRRIVELLKTTEKNIRSYDFLYKSILLLKKSIVNNYMEKNDNLPEVSIKQVAEINPESTRAIKEHENINYIDISSVSEHSGVIEDEIESYEYKEAPSRARRIVRCGDIIISTVRIYLKSYALISERHDGYVVSTGFCVLRPKRNLIFPELLFAFIKSENFIGLMDSYSTGTNYPAVSKDDIASYIIPLPTLNEQKEIIRKLSGLNLTEKRIISRKDRLTLFKKKVLDSL